MPDFSDLPVGGWAVALAAWAYFMHFCPWRSKRAGIAFEEPPLWLYGTAFQVLVWVSALPFLYVGYVAGSGADLPAAASERLLPVGLAGAALIVAGGVLWALASLYRRWQAAREEVVYEPMPVGAVLRRLAVIVGLPAFALSISPVLGLVGIDAPGTGEVLDTLDAGTFAAGLIVFLLLWMIPRAVEDRLEAADLSPVWARSTGLEYFRWAWAGLIGLAGAGALGALPGLEAVLGYPLSVAAGVGLGAAGGVVFGLFWGLPMRVVARKVAEGDRLAEEMQRAVRLFGLLSLATYLRLARSRDKMAAPGQDRQLCATCLRPINDITLYKNFKFEACPHCSSFIPPVFTMLDFVKHQSARVLPIIEQDESGRRRRRRGADTGALVQDLLRGLIAMAVQERGTDVHFLTEGSKFIVRCRTDGILYNMVEFEPIMARPLISALKVQANLDITERRKPQDGSFHLPLGDRTIDIRLNTSPVPDGEMAAARLLYHQPVLGAIDKLGMNPRNRKLMEELLLRPSGLILVTGPTGSGKSTTLYNSLQMLADGRRNIITLEDPIEYQIQGTTQMQINEKKGFTFATGLRTILRQDPDVIMVGEIRDQETAKMAIDAAATGHLVFSTLHAIDTAAVMNRLADLGVEIKRYAAVALLALAQRLVRLNCSQCLTDRPITREGLREQGFPGAPEERYILKRGLGCPACHESGFFGREGIFEFFIPNDAVKEMIAQGATVLTLRQAARRMGMRTLLEDGLVKVLLGRTTPEEVHRVTS